MPNFQIAKLDVWFVIHRHVMQSILIISVLSFVLIFYAKNWEWADSSSLKGFSHSIVGIVTIFLCFVQPFIAYFRPGKYDDKRPMFNFLHRSIGLLTYLLSSKIF